MLLEFHQSAEEVFRMDEGDTVSVHVDLRLSLAQHAGALRPDGLHGRIDVVYRKAEVVNAATGVAFEKLGNRRVRP